MKTDSRSGNKFGYGGKGVEGKEKWLVGLSGGQLTYDKGTMVLTANACGAVSYKWWKNGVLLANTKGTYAVKWAKGGATDTYEVAPVYSVYGKMVVGSKAKTTVQNMPRGTFVTLD